MSLSEYVRREDLKSLYALPMKEASKKLGVSESSLRNICRKHNIERWPYRKFQQLDAHIASLQNVEASQQSAQQREMIESLLRARTILEDNPNVTCEMAILQANKQIMSNNPNASSHDMTAVMMMMMMNSSSQEDSSPTIASSCAESVAQSSSQMNPSNNNNNHHSQNGANFVPIYPVHVTSHLSASAALSAMARRKKPMNGELTPSNVIHHNIHQNTNMNAPNLNNNGWNASPMMNNTIPMGQRPMHQQVNTNTTRFTDTELMQSYANINNGNIPVMMIDPHHQQQQQNQQQHSPQQINSQQLPQYSQEFSERRFAVSHRDSVALKSGFMPPTQNYPANGNNAYMMNNNNNSSLSYGAGPMDENENNVMMDSNAGEMNHMMSMSNDMSSHYLAQQQIHQQQQQQQPMTMQHVQITTTNAEGMMDPNLEISTNGDLTSKSRHISLLKQFRKQIPQPRSLSTSTATSSQHTSPIMRDLNANWTNNGNNNMGQASPLKTNSFGFSSPQTPTSVSTPIQPNSNNTASSSNNNTSNSVGQLSGNNNMLSNVNTTNVSQQPPSLRSTMSGSIFSFSSDHMDDEDGDVGMLMSTSHNDLSFNSLSSSPYLSPFINTQQRTSTSSISSSTSDIFQQSSPHNRNFSLTNAVPPINSLFRDSNGSLQDQFNTDQFNISKQEQRETNQRILEALRSTPLNPVGVGQNSTASYDPLFDSDAFLRGRTSSVSSTDIRLSDSCTTPLTPTEQGRSSFSKISHF
ncbi:hypothetical protein FDP41_011970 [Naegleria fowleri]|uniref:RWP-RK domain-containing protein n=1 Tax=Naegleria fowleri TaxID=5763 RepID=A0A6A5CA17_NAEFO|nr:uncharacterized protein FDP41_011970 [Naegleria fowleri]KAF0982109.1 hypothetical protein FDP41_011970 [Naegleria fowleri]